MAESKHVTYEDAGVDTAEGGRAVDAIKQMVKETSRPEVIGGIGGFGGLFSAAALKDMEDPILISGTDGVGTKLVLAQILDRHETVGQDLVAMCVIDILASGAEPQSNGYSLVRKVIGVDGIVPGTPEAEAKKAELESIEVASGLTLADALLAPTRIYVKPILELLRGEAGRHVHAIAHITGGGITENLNRALPANVDALVQRDGAMMGWDVPPVITYISENAELTPNEVGRAPGHHLYFRERRAHAQRGMQDLQHGRRPDADRLRRGRVRRDRGPCRHG